MKQLSVREIAAVKRQFLNSLPAFKKVQKLQDKIQELQEEINVQLAIIEGGEAGIKALTGGYRSIDLIKCTYEDYLDANGQPKLDKAGRVMKKQVLTYVEPKEIIEGFNTMGVPGSDFDADKAPIEALTSFIGVDENETPDMAVAEPFKY